MTTTGATGRDEPVDDAEQGSIASVPGLGVPRVTVAHRAGQPEGPNTERMLPLAQSCTAMPTPAGASRNLPDRGRRRRHPRLLVRLGHKHQPLAAAGDRS